MLHRVHLLAHVENDFDAGEIYAEVARQREDQFESLEIGIGVESSVSLGPRRLQQTFTFIKPQRLRMNAVLIRHRANRVGFRLSTHN